MRRARLLVVAMIACAACEDATPKTSKAVRVTAQEPPPATTGPDMCELFFRAVDRLAECAKMTTENRETFQKLAREVQQDNVRPFDKGKLAKCQMSLHMLRTDVKLDCPELAALVPDVEIP